MDNSQHNPMDLEEIRARMRDGDAPAFWRSLEELADSPDFQDFLEDEFPQQARPLRMEMDRRQFMVLSGASLALAGLAGCRWQPQTKIVPYVKAPEEITHGKQLFYATAMPMGGYGNGLLVESNEGRPTKIEGNPDHPATLGSSNLFMQSATLTLYDPDRLRTVQSGNDLSTWETFLTAARNQMTEQRKKGGSGLRILTENVTSPTLAGQIKSLLAQLPAAKWFQFEPVGLDSVREGSLLAFGEVVNTIYDFSKANCILALDSDFLTEMAGSVRYARDFADKRRVRGEEAEMNRLYAIESTPTQVGTIADHRWTVRASEIEAVVRALAAKVGAVASSGETALPKGISQEHFDAIVEDLTAHKGSGVVIAGDRQTPAVHALIHAINAMLGNAGTTVRYTEPIEPSPANHSAELKELTDEMQQGKVEMLLILGGNPAYAAPADYNFGSRLAEVPFTAHLSLYYDETAARCKWALPEAHFLEAWSDIRAYDGTTSIVQPLIAPLYEGRSAHEVLEAVVAEPTSGYDLVRNHWKRNASPATDYTKFWEKTLNDGFIPNTAAAPKQPTVKTGFDAQLPTPTTVNEGDLEIIFAPDQTIWDGRFANNGWLQELPKPLSKLTWDNALLMSPVLMQRLKLDREQVVRLELRGRTLDVPVWPSFGHPDNSMTLHLGYGRERGGEKSQGIGFNANKLRASDIRWFATGVTLKPTGAKYSLATTENHHAFVKFWDKDPNRIDSQHKGEAWTADGKGFENRTLVRISDIADYRKGGEGAAHGAGEAHGAEGEHGGAGGEKKEGEHHSLTMYPEVVGGTEAFKSKYSYDYNDPDINQWAMAIDLNTCIGCGVCTIACQAENNIAVVGKDQVLRGREMHWIRVDRYYQGGLDNPATYFQPVTCMQCELAPCEPVCPVAATVHSHDGINQMVYNRCIGTKYCSNNCPYKVRRFNFLNYANRFEQPVLMLSKNPEVSVRSRGVMEKCTYCVQRISRARIEAKKQNRKVGGDEVVAACQQACPTQAIVFGDKNDPNSQVSKARAQKSNYTLLDELNVRPRTSYLMRLRNPNPKIGGNA